MGPMTRALTVFVVAAAALGCSGQGPQEPLPGSQSAAGRRTGFSPVEKAAAARVVPGEVLVRFRDNTDERLMGRIERECGLELLKVVSAPSLVLMKIVGGASQEEVLRRLKAFPEVLQAEPNTVRTLKEN